LFSTTQSGQNYFVTQAHPRQLVFINGNTKPWPGGHVNAAIVVEHETLDGNVALIVAVGGGDVAGQGEGGQAGEGQVGGASDTGFEHAAAPERHATLAAKLV